MRRRVAAGRPWQEAGQKHESCLTPCPYRTIRSRSARRPGIPMSMREQSQSHQNHTTMDRDRYRRWRSSMVEQLICNQQVAGSSPIASSVGVFSDGFPSGQREQTVNLSSLTSKVRILPRPPCQPSQIETSNTSNKKRSTAFMRNRTYAGVAQLVELQPSKLDVAGSRPVSRSVSPAHLAQLAEHVLGKDEVTRSIRVVGSRI